MTSLSVFRDIPPAQKLEGSLLKIYKQDNYSSKMFLAYRVCMTDEGHPWVSLVVQKTRLKIAQDPSLNYEYLPLLGMKSFIQAALELLFGKHSQAIAEKRVGGVHTVGDSGAFQLGAQFLRTWRKNLKNVCIVSCQKEQYGLIFQDMGFTVYEYSIWNPKELCSDPILFFDVMEHIPADSILVIGNIIDCRLTQNQWTKLMSIIKSKHLFPFFDIPCQGLSTGDLEEDTRLLQYFVSLGFEFFCSQSLSKNFGIYDEGVGILAVAALSNQDLLCVLSQLMNYVGALWGNPPARGARIITSVLCNPALFEEWKYSLKGVVENIMLVKEKVKEKLRLLGTPGSCVLTRCSPDWMISLQPCSGLSSHFWTSRADAENFMGPPQMTLLILLPGLERKSESCACHRPTGGVLDQEEAHLHPQEQPYQLHLHQRQEHRLHHAEHPRGSGAHRGLRELSSQRRPD